MNDYISKKALLEWLEQQPSQYKIIPTIESGRFDVPPDSDGEWKAISEVVQRENVQMRAALVAIKPYIDEDFPNGPDGESDATVGYRLAYKKIVEALSTTTKPECKCGGTGGYNLKFGQLGEETFPCEVCSADFFKPTGTQRVREAIADRYKNALHGWYNPVDHAACSYYSGYLNGVSDTLRLLGITIPGINAPEGDENDA